MKKAVVSFLIAMLSVTLFSSAAFAASALPSNTVWYEPANAAVGVAINLHALVYNNTSSTVTVTVGFNTTKGTLATATGEIAPQAAKTLTAAWKMPAASTIITGAVTKAVVTSTKKSVPSLVGTLGSITVAHLGTTTETTGVGLFPAGFPGSAQLNVWLAPIFNSIERFRTTEAATLTTLRDTSKAQVSKTQHSTVSADSTAPASDALSSTFSNPSVYFNYLYSSALAPVFSNAAVFYIVLVLLVLLVLRFIVNLLF